MLLKKYSFKNLSSKWIHRNNPIINWLRMESSCGPPESPIENFMFIFLLGVCLVMACQCSATTELSIPDFPLGIKKSLNNLFLEFILNYKSIYKYS